MHDLAYVDHPLDLIREISPRLVVRDLLLTPGNRASGPHRPRHAGRSGTTKPEPLAAQSVGAEYGPASRVPYAHPRRLRVVIVEDEVIVAIELEMLLEEMNADVVGVARSAGDACALVLQHRPDFVTMDINLDGDRDGISAARDIFATYGVRSIFISSCSDKATQTRAVSCHAIAWIKKPVDTLDLAAAVSLVARKGD